MEKKVTDHLLFVHIGIQVSILVVLAIKEYFDMLSQALSCTDTG